MKKMYILFSISLLLIPISYSNGGCIKLVDDVFVQMSHAPHVPKVNEKASFLFSFGNESGLIREEISGKIKIVQNGRTLLENGFKAEDGILDLKHEFKNVGLYEILLEFNVNGKEYMPEDFVVEVTDNNKTNYLGYFIFLITGFLIGILSFRFIGKKK